MMMTTKKCFLGFFHDKEACCNGGADGPAFIIKTHASDHQDCCHVLSDLTAAKARENDTREPISRQKIFEKILIESKRGTSTYIPGTTRQENINLLRELGYNVIISACDGFVIDWKNVSLHSSLLEQLKNEINPLKGCDTTNVDSALKFLKSHHPDISFSPEPCSNVHIGETVVAYIDITWKRALPPEGPPESPSLSILLDSLCSQIENEISPLKGCDSSNINGVLKFLKDQYPDITFASKTSFANVGGVNSVVIEWYRKENIIDLLEKQLRDGINPLEAGTSQDINTTINILKTNHPELIFNHKFISVGTSGCVQNGIEWKRIEQNPTPENIFTKLESQFFNGKNPLEGCDGPSVRTALIYLRKYHPDFDFTWESITDPSTGPWGKYFINWKRLEQPKETPNAPKEEKATAPSVVPPPLPKATKVYAEVLLQQLINKLKLSPLAAPLLKFIPDVFILAIAPMIINIPDETIVTFKTALFKLIPPEYHPMVRIAWP